METESFESMNSVLIAYENVDEERLELLWAKIREYKVWAIITTSLWAIKTNESALDVRNKLIEYIPEGGRLFVMDNTGHAAWNNIMCSGDWIKKYL